MHRKPTRCSFASRISFNQAPEANNPVYYAEQYGLDEGLNGVDIWDFNDHMCDQYCNIDQDEIGANMVHFNEGIHPSLPLAIYTWKEEKWQEFVQDANALTSEETTMTTGTKNELQCGGFMDP